LLSVSGKTRANIRAAKAVTGVAEEVIALTANPESELARLSSKVLQLKFTKSPRLTPGTNSFTTSLLAATFVLGKRPKHLDVAKMIAAASISDPVIFSGTIHFVGSGKYYPLAMYGCAKIFEFAGLFADYSLTEEFSHMNLFSVQENDCVVILPESSGENKALDLHENLTRNGVGAFLLPVDEEMDPIEQAISYAAHLQYFALRVAQWKGLNQPSFLEKKKLLEISNKMIY